MRARGGLPAALRSRMLQARPLWQLPEPYHPIHRITECNHSFTRANSHRCASASTPPWLAAWRPHHARALRRRRPADPTTVVVMALGARGVTRACCAPVAVSTAADEGGTGAAGRTELAPPAGTCTTGTPYFSHNASPEQQPMCLVAAVQQSLQRAPCTNACTRASALVHGNNNHEHPSLAPLHHIPWHNHVFTKTVQRRRVAHRSGKVSWDSRYRAIAARGVGA